VPIVPNVVAAAMHRREDAGIVAALEPIALPRSAPVRPGPTTHPAQRPPHGLPRCTVFPAARSSPRPVSLCIRADPLLAAALCQEYALVESVGSRLSEANGLPALRYFVLDNSDQNAFVSPTGVVVVYNGLLEALDSPDQLAIVLAHEMAHYVARTFLFLLRGGGLEMKKGAGVVLRPCFARACQRSASLPHSSSPSSRHNAASRAQRRARRCRVGEKGAACLFLHRVQPDSRVRWPRLPQPRTAATAHALTPDDLLPQQSGDAGADPAKVAQD